MFNLIIGLILIAIFFVLFFNLKRGYDEKEAQKKEKNNK